MPIDNLSKITSRSGINTTILLEAGNANVTGIVTAAGFDVNGVGIITGGIITNVSPAITIRDGTTEKGYIGFYANDPFIGRKNGVGLLFQDNKVRPVDGDTGIGTNNVVDLGEPTYKFKDLYLEGDIHIDSDVGQLRIGADEDLKIDHNGSNAYFMNGTGSTLNRAATHIFENANGSTEYVRIKSDGNVGIGTDAPDYGLHVFGAGDILVEDGNNGSAHLRLRSSVNGSDVSNWKIKTGSNNYLFIDNDTVGGTSQLTIDDSNRVGINSTSPTGDLDVVGSGTSTISTILINAITHNTSKKSEAVLKFGYAHSGSPHARGHIKMVEQSTNSFDADLIFGLPTNNSSGGSTTVDDLVRITPLMGTQLTRGSQGGRSHTGNNTNFFKIGTWHNIQQQSRLKITVFGIMSYDSNANVAGESVIYISSNANYTLKGHFHTILHGTRDGLQKVAFKYNSTAPGSCEVWIKYESGYSTTYHKVDASTGYWVGADQDTGSTDVPAGADQIFSSYAIATSDGTSSKQRIGISSEGNIGIGTGNPDQPLHLYTTEQNAIKWVSTNSDGPLVSYFHSSTHVGAIGNSKGVMSTTDVHFGIGSKSDLVFGTKPSGGGSTLERMRIKEDGEVHISDRNTSNTGDHFFQAGAFGIRMEDTGGYNRWNIERNYGGFKSTPVVHLSAQSRVGINTTSPEGTLDVTSEIGSEPLGAIFRKDYAGDTTDASHKVALTIWGMDHNDLDHTGQDAYGPMIGFGVRNDRSAPNTGDVRAAISYRYNGNLTFHTEAGGSITDGSNESLRITSKGTTIAYHGAAPTDALTYSSSFRGREGVISPIYYWPRSYGAHSNGGGYDDVAEGGRLTLRLVGATGGTVAMFHGGFGITYGGGGEAIEYNRVRVIFRASRANTTDGYTANSITFKMQQYYYNGGWTDISNSAWNFDGTDSERGYRWTASNWISSADFAGGFDVPSIAIKYDTDNGNLSNANMRIAAVYLQYARFS